MMRLLGGAPLTCVLAAAGGRWKLMIQPRQTLSSKIPSSLSRVFAEDDIYSVNHPS
jgi:hypothetical protein